MLDRSFFVSWFKAKGRYFPWREDETTPFQFLMTEMLLRQTRAPEVAKLWQGLIDRYPDAHTLANADMHELRHRISILGFGRMRSEALTHAAQCIVTKHGGQIPENLQLLLKIPHVGNYTAHAVLCFGFGQRIEIVDGNVQRFFSRYYGLTVKADIRRNPVIKELAYKALPRKQALAKAHNYGLLDFTADICKPGRPRCEVCPLSATCRMGRERLKIDDSD